MRIFKVAYHGAGSPLSGVYFYSEASAEMFLTKYFSTRAYRACNVPDYWVTECEWTEVHLANLQQEIWKYPIWYAALKVIPNHFAHVSEDDPNMIAFTASVEHGIADRQTRMRPGKYLARFYTDMEPKKVAYYAEWWRTGTKPRVEPAGELQFASTPDEIEHVYEVGPYSCMYGKDSVRVYGAGDLAIANILYGDKVLSRALCWPDKKVFGRIYPNTCDWKRDGADSENDAQNRVDDLMTRFMDMGWTSTSAGGDALFTGARLLKIRCGGGDYLMPYSDHGGVRDGGSHWVMDYHNAEHSCQQTSGLLLDEEEEEEEYEHEYICGHCDEEVDEVNDVVHSVLNGAYSQWCNNCVRNDSFYCVWTERHYHMRTVPYIELANGDYMVLNEAEQHAYRCEWSDEWHLIDVVPPHQVWVLDADAGGWKCEKWCRSAAVCAAKFCDWLGIWVEKTVWADVVETPPAPYLAVAYGQTVAA